MAKGRIVMGGTVNGGRGRPVLCRPSLSVRERKKGIMMMIKSIIHNGLAGSSRDFVPLHSFFFIR